MEACHCLCAVAHPGAAGICDTMNATATARVSTRSLGVVGIVVCKPCADAAERRRMTLWGPCERCGAARATRPIASEGVPGRPGTGGVADQLWCPACDWPDPTRDVVL
jgi:hypothetical protein